MTNDAFTQRLRSLIGRNCYYFGRDCRIVEILSGSDDEQGHLVLEAFDAVPPIQADQFGQAVFRANEHIEVPIQGPLGEFSEELMHLLDGLETEAAR